jgi:hypothetical protein
MQSIFKIFKRLKIAYIFLIIFFFLLFIFSRRWIYSRDEISYGVTFSQKQAIALGLDWKNVFIAMLNDLRVKNLRLSAYWDDVEPQAGKFSWTDLDWQIAAAGKNYTKIILAVGGRLPRWPECHTPAWAVGLDKSAREAEIIAYITATIKRYKDDKNISAWQIENEPFLTNFGECPEFDKNFLDKEITAVRALDNRQIIITDSGELSLWVPAAKRADIFGTTMYRDTYSKLLKSYIHYPIEPGFFSFKKNITQLFANPQKMIVIELQAEPWGPIPYQKTDQTERNKTMSPDKLKDILEFSRQTGFREFYLWGVEWWYWEKTTQNRPEFWNIAQKIFKAAD